jgi:hypothetical protein
VTANIDNAMEILQNNTHLSPEITRSIFQHYFLSGYRGAIWFLVAVSLIAFLAVLAGLNNQKPTGDKTQPILH